MKTLTKNLLAVAKIACKDEVGPAFASVFISKDALIATDGFKMLKIDRNEEQNSSIINFPIISGNKLLKKLDEPILISARQILNRQKFDKTTDRALPVLSEAVLVNDNDDTVSISTTDLETTSTITYKKIKAKFPSVDKAIPDKSKAIARVKVDPKILIELLAAFKDKKSIDLHLFEYTKPILITSEEKTGVLMPLTE